jgi:hypothetical protein
VDKGGRDKHQHRSLNIKVKDIALKLGGSCYHGNLASRRNIARGSRGYVATLSLTEVLGTALFLLDRPASSFRSIAPFTSHSPRCRPCWSRCLRRLPHFAALLVPLEDGTFSVRARAEGGFVLCVVYRGKPTHHHIALDDESGMLRVNGKSYGSNTADLHQVSELATCSPKIQVETGVRQVPCRACTLQD